MQLKDIMNDPNITESQKEFYKKFDKSLQKWSQANTEKMAAMVEKSKSKREIINSVRHEYKTFVQDFFSQYRDEQLDAFNDGQIDIMELKDRLSWLEEEQGTDEELEEFVTTALPTT